MPSSGKYEQMMYLQSGPSMFFPNCLEMFRAISAKAGTSTRMVGLNIAISLNICVLSWQMCRQLPV